jgi:hypothetical protein
MLPRPLATVEDPLVGSIALARQDEASFFGVGLVMNFLPHTSYSRVRGKGFSEWAPGKRKGIL